MMGLNKLLGIKPKFCVDCEKRLPTGFGSNDEIIEFKDGLRCLECAKKKVDKTWNKVGQ